MEENKIVETPEKEVQTKKTVIEHKVSVWNFLVYVFKWLMTLTLIFIVFIMITFIVAIFNPSGVKNAIDIIKYMFGGNI